MLNSIVSLMGPESAALGFCMEKTGLLVFRLRVLVRRERRREWRGGREGRRKTEVRRKCFL